MYIMRSHDGRQYITYYSVASFLRPRPVQCVLNNTTVHIDLLHKDIITQIKEGRYKQNTIKYIPCKS